MPKETNRRDKGAGSITKFNNGRYRGRLRYTLEPHGKQISKYFYGTTKSEVRK